ncbi:MAG: PSD1 and planctomycete cytochrome C domain-containing protein [Verrucomicrobiia bacterium]|jgi:hypothetical protein
MKKFVNQIALLVALPLFATAAELPTDHAARMKAGTALFQKTIGPALKSSCLKCHGGEKVRSGLNMANRELFVQGGDSGSPIDLNNPGESLVLKLLRHEEEPNMPPKQSKLSDALLDSFTRWIELGAPFDKPLLDSAGAQKQEMVVTESDREFWSFRPLRKVKLPSVDAAWAKTDIDRFVFSKSKANGLSASSPADNQTFIRRAYLDLIGLPPTPEQLAAGLSMTRANLIDSLLNNPHHGERWARHWLDAARFAESHGFEQDYNREFAFHYRDFVIKALNADMPFDQFVRWQLAGDEIAPDDPLAMMATGFLGAGVFPTQLTEKEFESARYDELDDMAATMGTAMLGLTIGCARCHDHKFDPIPVKDYYRIVSSFTTTIRSEIELDLDPHSYTQAKADWEQQHAAIKAPLAAHEARARFKAAFDHWLKTDIASTGAGPWSVLDIAEASSSQKTVLTPQTDGAVLATGKAPKRETYTLKADVSGRGIQWLRIEALTYDSLRRKGPGRAGNGNFALSNLKVFATRNQPGAKRKQLKFESARATHQQNTGSLSVAASIDSNPTGTGWAVDKGGIGKDQAAVFKFSAPVGSAEGTRFEFQLMFANNSAHSMGRVRLSVSSESDPPVVVGGGQSQALATAFAALKSGQLESEHRRTLFPLFAKSDATWRSLNGMVQTSLRRQPQPVKARVQVSSEGLPPTKHHADGRGFPHFYPETHFLSRGDPNQKLGVAPQGFLQVLTRNGRSTDHWHKPPPKGWRTSYRRRALADWITDAKDGAGHLLARVIVNRVWQHHFGRGIVSTPNDFGLQGTDPTHPDLLEFLARQLIADGWKLKPLHRRIMLSAAYGQSSAPDATKAALDPDNRWLWRFQPRRLEAEIIRDALLASSGKLNPEMFGKGTLNANHTRRSIYFMIKRSQLVPMMQIFDQPEPLVSQGGRPSTTIAPQALMFMNGQQVVDWARALAKTLPADQPEAAVREVYLRVLQRHPIPAEIRDARAFIKAQSSSYDSADATQLALADFCQVVFGLNEFVYLQ